jgi:PAS domain S-box-containing protein
MIEEAHDDALQRLRELTDNLIGPDVMAAWLEDLPIPFLVVRGGREGPIVYFNAAAELFFGYARSEVLGRSVDVLVPDAVRPAHAGHRAAYERDPRKRPMGSHLELAARHKSGEEIPVEISLSPKMTVAGLMTSAVIWRKRAAT